MAVESIELPSLTDVVRNIQEWGVAHAGFARLIATGIPQAQALTQWGGQLLREGRTADATRVFLSALALTPEDALLWTNLGIAWDRADSPLEAAKCLERSLRLHARQPETWLLLGIAKKKAGDLEGAEIACRTAIEKGVASALAWQCLALIKQEQAEYADAIECFVKCAECGGADAAIHANLGRLYYQTGRIPEAYSAYTEAARLETANAHYQRMLRRVQFVNDVLREIPVDDAANAYRNSPATDGDDPAEELHDVFKKTFGLLSGFGHVAAAAHIGQRLLDLWPSATTEYLLKAVAGDSGLVRTPPDVVVEHFDSFAEGFEAQLIERLRYDVPKKISVVLREAMDSELLYDVLDAGCGTGLCGPLLRPVARELTGVDLSPKMLDQAERRGIYDSLICEELTQFLERSPGQFDIMAAADVLIYFGDLRPVFAATAIALRPGGLLAMSIELNLEEDFRIQRSGRFAHAPNYVRLCAGTAFEECACLDTTMRLEANEPVRGNIFLFRRTE